MRAGRRWRRWAVMGGALLAVAALPVAARPEGERPTPALEVRVATGDTIWSLAREHGDPHRDVRDVVTVMLQTNRVRPGDLQPGQVLVIPAPYAVEDQAASTVRP